MARLDPALLWVLPNKCSDATVGLLQRILAEMHDFALPAACLSIEAINDHDPGQLVALNVVCKSAATAGTAIASFNEFKSYLEKRST